jgi:hypothetical protein
MKRATQNKFLILNKGVVLTPIIEPVIVALDEYFAAFNHVANVTSGLRNPDSQLKIIRDYLAKKGLKAAHNDAFIYDVDKKINDSTYGEIYAWQLGWSKLLNIGVIINPPIAAICLMDYIRSGVNKKGNLIHGSPHFKGTAFDIGGSINGIADETLIIQKAIADKLPGLINVLPERENNANHCDCIAV